MTVTTLDRLADALERPGDARIQTQNAETMRTFKALVKQQGENVAVNQQIKHTKR